MKNEVEKIVGPVTEEEFEKAKDYSIRKLKMAEEREKRKFPEWYLSLLVADTIRENRFSDYTYKCCFGGAR